jgi:hypothetical protein
MNDMSADKVIMPEMPAKSGNAAIKLSKPLEHGDDEIFELTLRPPTVDDLADIGYPFTVSTGDGDTSIELKPKAILKYASRLAGVPPSVLKGMALKDFMAVQTEIMGFFGDLAETPPS